MNQPTSKNSIVAQWSERQPPDLEVPSSSRADGTLNSSIFSNLQYLSKEKLQGFLTTGKHSETQGTKEPRGYFGMMRSRFLILGAPRV